MPGISAMTITAGPEPSTYTRLATPASVISRRLKSSSGSSSVTLRPDMAVTFAGEPRQVKEIFDERDPPATSRFGLPRTLPVGRQPMADAVRCRLTLGTAELMHARADA